MKHQLIRLICIFIFFTEMGCSTHLIKDRRTRESIRSKFEQRQEAFLKNRQLQLLDIFNTNLTIKEKEALQFLYAYETLSDLSNYDAEFYLKQVRYALKTQTDFPWGTKVSEDDFLHFVLPPRAGTENLDSARAVIYHALKDRLKGLTMKEAALEVNHWCHEKVTYVGSDSRTSAPLATMKNAKGRCGEESVFTVTALRAVGIPARQIYTPRWAHQDDNHAWVEFWADGKWYFYGACEPQPDVNQGWFVEPSRRAMLTATQTPGNYPFSDVISSNDNYTRLNLISNYAPAKDVIVHVLDSTGNNLSDADVGFLISNYAELYEIASLKTDDNGFCKIKLGLGDVVVWASKGDHYGFEKITVAEADTVKIAIVGNDFSERSVDFDLVPPIQKEPVKVSPEGIEKNNKRLSTEDSIRTAYEKTFMKKEMAFDLAINLNLDTALVWQQMKKSRGNWMNISQFFGQATLQFPNWVLPLLNELSDKDLHDATSDILLSHLNDSPAFNDEYTKEDYARFILNPRIGLEQLSAYKSYLRNQFDNDFWTNAKKNPDEIAQWIGKNIKLSDTENYIWVPAIPQGVFEMKTTDRYSAKIFFVAMCRTAGVLSRIDPATGIAQYRKNDQWINVPFDQDNLNSEQDDAFGVIHLVGNELDGREIRYSKDFTLAKFESGKYKTLDYEFNKPLSQFPKDLVLSVGNYLLYTCERLKDGTVLSHISFFSLEKEEHKDVIVSIRNKSQFTKPMVKLQLPERFNLLDGASQKFDQCTMNRGLVLIWLDPDKEPSKHVLKDLEDLKMSFDEMNTSFVFLLPEDERAKVFNPRDYNLPMNSYFGSNRELLPNLEKIVGNNFDNQLPVLLVLSPDNEISFISSGYKIGVGDQLLKELKVNSK